MPRGQLAFRPRTAQTVAMLIAVPLFCTLGAWQLERAAEKRALRERLDARWDAPAATLPARPDWTALEHGRVTTAGRYVGARQFLVGDRVSKGLRGLHVITPLRDASGRELLVNRGWVASPEQATPPPEEPVAVTGRITLPQLPALELGPAEPASDPWHASWSRLDPGAYARVAGVAPLPAVLLLDPDQAHGFVREWPRPTGGLAPALHVGYAVQWFAFALIALLLWLRHALHRPADRGSPA